MRARLLALLLVAWAASGCSIDGSSEPATTSVTTPPATSTAPKTMRLTVYRVERGVLRPRVVAVARTQGVAGAALHALGIDAAVAIRDGVAIVDAPSASDDQAAEIVYTLTQFATVQRVDVGARTGLTRDDFPQYVAPVVILSPAPRASVPTTFRVTGEASVFEATLVVQAVRDGKVLSKQTVTASEGAPARGTYAATITATAGPLTVQVFSPSAADGSPQHEADVDVTVTP